MTPQQPSLALGAQYDANSTMRELQMLHERINRLGITPNVENLKTDHDATQLATPASVASALNATNAALNTILAKMNLTKP